jgi:hypothetical protein
MLQELEKGIGALVGIEVKASATVNVDDFKGLRKLSSAGGDDFKLGLVLYDGERAVPFGERLVAAPISSQCSEPRVAPQSTSVNDASGLLARLLEGGHTGQRP